MQLLLALAILPAYMVGSFFIKSDPGEPEPDREIRRAVYFGFLSVIIAMVLGILFSLLFTGGFALGVDEVSKFSSLPFVSLVFVFAATEEFAKFLPLAWYLRNKPFFNEHTDGIIYFSLAGLTFGAVENLLYGFGAGEGGAMLIILRLVISLFFHGALNSLIGFFYARSKVTKKSLLPTALALVGAIVLHTTYNYFAYNFESDALFMFAAAAIAIWTNGMMFWLFYVAAECDMKLGLTRNAASVQDGQTKSS